MRKLLKENREKALQRKKMCEEGKNYFIKLENEAKVKVENSIEGGNH